MISYEDVLSAQERISPYVCHTPLLRVEALDETTGFITYVKPENLQPMGAFKLRGATNKILSLTTEEKARGVITASSGNHGMAVSLAALKQGIQAVIVLPEDVSAAKLKGIQDLGAKTVFCGHTSDERNDHMYILADKEGYTIVHAFEDSHVIAGQGTAALEALSDEPELEAFVGPVGGGGFISGIATAAKGANTPRIVVGVEPMNLRRYAVSREAKEPKTLPRKPTITDGTRGISASLLNFPCIELCVDELVAANDDAVKAAMFAYAKFMRLVVEPSGALPLAAAIGKKLPSLNGKKVCLIISGGNCDFRDYTNWLLEGADIFDSIS